MNKGIKKINKIQRLTWIRNVVQMIFFLFLPSLFSQAFGGVKEMAAKVGSGEPFLWSSFLMKLTLLCMVTMIIGRVFCGWMCAFGALGDWIYQFSAFLQKKTKRKLPKISERMVHILQKIKYVVLLGIMLLCFMGSSNIVTTYSPWTIFSLLMAGQFQIAGYAVGGVILLLILIGMSVQERFFCQFLCPMGAVFSLLPELPLFRWKRKEENCIRNCQACKKMCPVQIKLQENPLQEGECIRCGRCTQICPRKNIKWKKSASS